MNPLLIPILATGAATAIAGDTIRKAGDNKKIKEILEKNKMYEQMLGSPTGGFGYQTGFGPVWSYLLVVINLFLDIINR